MSSKPFKIAIVGCGPKGLYAFERLLAELKATPIHRTVSIYLFNKTKFWGSGDVYRSDQPKYLLMNFSNKHIQLWTKESPKAVIDLPMNLSEYLAKINQKIKEKLDPLFSSRAVVGEYLENGFEQLCQNLPDNVSINQLISEVNSIKKNAGSYSISFKQQEGVFQINDFQNILICTGHQGRREKVRRAQVDFIYPIEKQLKNITKNDSVAIKGMGLTFIDAALALTEGKGGKFSATKAGGLTYKASGNEPKCMFPFSTSGCLMWPKYSFEDSQHLYIKNLTPYPFKKLNFKNDILPLLEQDMELAYYKTLFTHENESLNFHSNYDVVRCHIKNFHQKYPKYKAFAAKHFFEPEFNSGKSVHQTIVTGLSDYTDPKKLKIEDQAKLRAGAIWRKISPVFNELYAFNGLDAKSHKDFDKYYFKKLNRIAYGPPPVNLRKILALAHAGYIDFQYAKNPEVFPFEKGYKLKSSTSETHCSVLIDARIPKNDIAKEASGLYKNLCKNLLSRPYINMHGKTTYEPGSVEINKKGNLINTEGHKENISLYGTPTEGIVHDNDTLSRTRNNFATPWAQEVMNQLMNSQHENKQQLTKTIATTK
ncbi:FAD/NAD(P)-binding protein [Psychroflexus montanilacus]|uniref:FAD/NAD(P)-binding protein n=1 Tax=Psychroflexus montanilacus TaxID=2873598 RepID=UPI001CCBDA28|nr:FAD/NAD(P)-binding protein [Psychroflexus montanilacus]MBZ9650918.1 FAD/NAD(P)-binding protein [Psychroflexus montanilacus]